MVLLTDMIVPDNVSIEELESDLTTTNLDTTNRETSELIHEEPVTYQ